MGGHYILKLNNKCNANCIFCEIPREDKKKKEPSLKDKLKELRENRKKFDSVIITGGEPAIYPDILKFIRYAKNICRYKQITLESNGLLFYYKGFLNKLIKGGVDKFQVSFQTTDKKEYDNILRVNGSYNRVINGIKNIKENRKFLSINIVVHKYNYKKLPDVIKELVNKKADYIQLSFVNPIKSKLKGGKIIPSINHAEVKYTKAYPYIRKALETAKNLQFKEVSIVNFPICLAKDFIDKLCSSKQEHTKIELYEKVKNNYLNKEQIKVKVKKCKKCVYFYYCEGVWYAYLKRFGDKEIKPSIRSEHIEKRIEDSFDEGGNKSSDSLFDKYLFEIIGSVLGIKRASILYLKKEDLTNCAKELKKKGYFYEFSDFCYLIKDEITKKIRYGSKKGEYSLYISKDKEICKRLKYLDYYHQFKIKEPKGMSSKDIFLEIGNMLGYPKCCSKFLWSCKENQQYEKLFVNSNRQYQDETIYKLLALKNKSKVLYQLNNFSIGYPNIFNFFVCKYSCKKALSIANKLLDYIKENYKSEYKSFVDNLKNPIVFFSAYRIIYLLNAVRKKKKIHYDGCFYRDKTIQNLNKHKKEDFNRKFMMFLMGDSFKMEDKRIIIYKKGKPIYFIIKNHPNDGIFIEFE